MAEFNCDFQHPFCRLEWQWRKLGTQGWYPISEVAQFDGRFSSQAANQLVITDVTDADFGHVRCAGITLTGLTRYTDIAVLGGTLTVSVSPLSLTVTGSPDSSGILPDSWGVIANGGWVYPADNVSYGLWEHYFEAGSYPAELTPSNLMARTGVDNDGNVLHYDASTPSYALGGLYAEFASEQDLTYTTSFDAAAWTYAGGLSRVGYHATIPAPDRSLQALHVSGAGGVLSTGGANGANGAIWVRAVNQNHGSTVTVLGQSITLRNHWIKVRAAVSTTTFTAVAFDGTATECLLWGPQCQDLPRLEYVPNESASPISTNVQGNITTFDTIGFPAGGAVNDYGFDITFTLMNDLPDQAALGIGVVCRTGGDGVYQHILRIENSTQYVARGSFGAGLRAQTWEAGAAATGTMHRVQAIKSSFGDGWETWLDGVHRPASNNTADAVSPLNDIFLGNNSGTSSQGSWVIHHFRAWNVPDTTARSEMVNAPGYGTSTDNHRYKQSWSQKVYKRLTTAGADYVALAALPTTTYEAANTNISELQAQVDAASAAGGGVVVMSNGNVVYDNATRLHMKSNVQLQAHRWGSYFVQSATGDWGGHISVDNCENVSISNIVFDGSYLAGSVNGSIQITDSSNVEVRRCTMTSAGSTVNIGNCTNVTVCHNTITVVEDPSAAYSVHGIVINDYSGPTSTSVSIHSNTIDATLANGYAIDSHAAESEIMGNDILVGAYSLKFPDGRDLFFHHNRVQITSETTSGPDAINLYDNTDATIPMSGVVLWRNIIDGTLPNVTSNVRWEIDLSGAQLHCLYNQYINGAEAKAMYANPGKPGSTDTLHLINYTEDGALPITGRDHVEVIDPDVIAEDEAAIVGLTALTYKG